METFKDKIVVITGAGSGIGRAIAQVFSELGADLVLADVNQQRLLEVKDQIESKGGKVSTFQVDVADRERMKAFAREVIENKGRVDVLINNAGVALGGEIKDMTLEDWDWLVGVNYWGVVHGIHFFLPHMIERGSGHIVNTASANGLAIFPFEGPYASTKFAVVGLTEVLRAEVARFGIGVTAVCPGLIRTNIAKDARVRADDPKGHEAHASFKELMARRGTDPIKVARSIPPAIRKNKALVRVPFQVVLLDLFNRFAPGPYRWVMAMIVRRMA